MGPEFKSRDDGFPGLQKAYGFTLPGDQQHEVNDAIVYSEVGKGGTATSARSRPPMVGSPRRTSSCSRTIKQFFPIYNPAITIRSELAEKYPELEDGLRRRSPRSSTDDTLLALNEQVSVDAEDPKKVATEWMREQGFIG